MAIVVALLLKVFIVEAYKIPSGSMQPTLIGIDEPGTLIEDRILVDKLSLVFRDPKRWEIVVFRYPLDRSKTFVKRIVGMPGEHFKIELGDLWQRETETDRWKVLRRPRAVQRSAWKRLGRGEPDEPGWSTTSAGWSVAGDTITAAGTGRAGFRPGRGSIMDTYDDGYPEAILALGAIPRVHQGSGMNPVGDLRIEGTIRAGEGCEALLLELTEGGRSYVFRIPGPAADSSEAPTIRLSEGSFRPSETAGAESPYHLPAERGARFAAQNLDDLLELEIDGEVVCSLEVPPGVDQTSSVSLEVHGEGAELEDLLVSRDIFYTSDRAKVWQTRVPEESYFVLGDNTQSSADSREWSLMSYRVEDPESGQSRLLRAGHERENGNPYIDAGHPEGPLLWVRDEWGERYSFPLRDAPRVKTENAPFVPRDLILGRAVAVFWPVTPWHGVYRFGWVR